MKEIYWIQRIGCIDTICTVLFCTACLALVLLLIAVIVCRIDGIDTAGEKDTYLSLKRFARMSAITAAILVVPVILIPSKREMYEIYGIGGTIDWVRNNETAKSLPDKTITALDKWLDNLTDGPETGEVE